ncbi:MAG: acyl carrier protein [Proteobacteria bacterium]|nr:acyl carrier protein [Pseudomonadota bacterium]
MTGNVAITSPEGLAELKQVILEAVDHGEPPGGLREDEPLFGPESRLDLDSLDALQLSMAIQTRYGVRMPDSKQTRQALQSLLHLARHLQDAAGQPASP